jgi:hypothetical protein
MAFMIIELVKSPAAKLFDDKTGFVASHQVRPASERALATKSSAGKVSWRFEPNLRGCGSSRMSVGQPKFFGAGRRLGADICEGQAQPFP